jgi:hypothetical protein
MVYSVISILAPSQNLNPITGAIGLRIGLNFIPELIAILAFVCVGLATHNLRRTVKDTPEGEVQILHRRRERSSMTEGVDRFSSGEV